MSLVQVHPHQCTILLLIVASLLQKVSGAHQESDQTCATKDCRNGYKCVMVQPHDCVGCDLVPRCYRRNCNTNCWLHCEKNDEHMYNGCILMAHRNCPVPICGWADGPPVEEPPPDTT